MSCRSYDCRVARPPHNRGVDWSEYELVIRNWERVPTLLNARYCACDSHRGSLKARKI